MNIVPYDRIQITDRQRKKINTPELNELKESIAQRGLLNAPVVGPVDGEGFRLVAGERRYRAIGLLHKEQRMFYHNGVRINVDAIPVTFIQAENLLQEKEAELDENIQRVDLTWQERAEALASIHKDKQILNPKQTYKETAEAIAPQAKVKPDYARTAIREAVIISEHLDDPTIANARSASEAHALILKKDEERIKAEMARRRIATMKGQPLDIKITHGDLFDVLPQMDAGQADLFLVDVPFGIDASGGGFRARTVHHHNYDDTEENSWNIQKEILVQGFRICKPQANIFMFTSIKWWERLQRVSAQIGWTPFPRPMIWGKSDSEGLAPWGAQGPRITTEFIFFATKGQKGLLASPIDYLRVNRVSRSERIHAAEKPVELLKKLIECSTLPGDLVIDPCAGSGSTLVAAKELKRRARGIEKDEAYYNTAMANVYGGGDALK
jgi:hypothetical protein